MARSQNPAAYRPSRWAELASGLYVRNNGSDLLSLRQDGRGRMWLFLDLANTLDVALAGTGAIAFTIGPSL